MMTAVAGPIDVTAARARARDQAERAAARAGVTVRELDLADSAAAGAAVLAQVWRSDVPPVPANLLRTVQYAGGYVYGAYDQSESMVGTSMAFLGAHGLHSHITGVVTPGQGIGQAMKMHQRWWALERDITAITWTCDPLVRRNMVFNLHALGSTVTAYLIAHYGEMVDGVNAGDESDRVDMRWDLLDTTGPRHRPEAGDRPIVVGVDPQGRPVVSDPVGIDRLVALPADIETLRRDDPVAAMAWRHAIRGAVGSALEAGGAVVGITEDGYLAIDEARRNGEG